MYFIQKSLSSKSSFYFCMEIHANDAKMHWGVCGGQGCLPSVTHRATRETTIAMPPPKKSIIKPASFFNDLLKAWLILIKASPKHKIDWTSCCSGHAQQLINQFRNFYSPWSLFQEKLEFFSHSIFLKLELRKELGITRYGFGSNR